MRLGARSQQWISFDAFGRFWGLLGARRRMSKIRRNFRRRACWTTMQMFRIVGLIKHLLIISLPENPGELVERNIPDNLDPARPPSCPPSRPPPSCPPSRPPCQSTPRSVDPVQPPSPSSQPVHPAVHPGVHPGVRETRPPSPCSQPCEG
jgi:hypothetical protein